MKHVKEKNSAALFIVFVALLLYSCRGRTGPSASIVDVTVLKVQTEELVLTTELPGRVSALRVAEIRPQVSGIIQKRLFEEGSDVKVGEILYQIEPAPFRAAYDNAKAALSRADARIPATRLRLDRYKELLLDKAVSQQDYDDVDAAMKQAIADVAYAKASADAARINLEFTKVTAPISGRIGRSSVTDGALVTAHQPLALATIQQLDSIYVDLPQPTSTLLKLRRNIEKGQLSRHDNGQNKVKIILEDDTLYDLEGLLQFRDVTVDTTTGSVILRAIVPNPKNTLLPGMFVRAVVQEGVQKEAMLIPQQSVLRDPKGNPYVFLVGADGIVQQRMVVIDRAVGDRWLVLSGLNVGDQVITDNMQKIRPGVPVKALSAGAQETASSGSVPVKTN